LPNPNCYFKRRLSKSYNAVSVYQTIIIEFFFEFIIPSSEIHLDASIIRFNDSADHVQIFSYFQIAWQIHRPFDQTSAHQCCI